MINREVYMLIIDDKIYYADKPIYILIILASEWFAFNQLPLSNEGFIDWFENFLVKNGLVGSYNRYLKYLNRLGVKGKCTEEDFNEFEKIADMALNELHYLRYPYIIYGKVNKQNISSLKDLLYIFTNRDNELTEITFNNIVKELNRGKNSGVIRFRRYVSPENIMIALIENNKGESKEKK